MCAKSDQQEQVEQLMSEYGSLGQQIGGMESQIKNPFEDYKLPFNYENMAKMIDEITQQNLGQVNRQATEDVNRASTQTTEGMASQGVTGGSILNTAVDKSKNPIYKNKYNLTEQLYGQGMQGKLGAMGEENKYNFAATGQEGQFDLANIENLMKKFGMMGGNIGAKGGLLGAYDETTWLDDLFAGLNTAANVAGKVAGASDVRFKTNISYTGNKTKDGIPIVEFNYIWDSTKRRGVIAQEVELIRPDAVIEIDGYKYVKYEML